MRKIKMKLNKRQTNLLIVLVFFSLLVSIYYLNSGFANVEEPILIENSFSLEDRTLNPAWVYYNKLTPEQKLEYKLVPEMYLNEYDNDVNPVVSTNGFELEFGASANDKYYNLKNHNLTLAPKDQGSTGLCWAFSALASTEGNMIKTGLATYSKPVSFAVRQLDYATVNKYYITEEYNPYTESVRTELLSGGYGSTAYGILESGVGPVTETKFGSWNTNTSKKSLNDVINVNNVEYSITGYANFGSVTTGSSASNRNSWISLIKHHIIQYGEVAIGTIGPQSYYAGACLYYDSTNGIYLINDDGNCNPSTSANGHAMTIIGWDDNYTYKYCKGYNSTSSSISGCSNVVSGQGAFILKNSWGSSVQYPYLTYTSNVYFANGTTGVEVKDWDINYDHTKQREFSSSGNTYIVKYKKGSAAENLKRVSFSSLYRNVTYTVSVSNDGSNYKSLGTIGPTTFAGNYSVDVSNYSLTGKEFYIKVVASGGGINIINAFTSYNTSTSAIVIDTNAPASIMGFDSYFDVYTSTRNIPVGAKVTYKLFDEDGWDITNLFTIPYNTSVNGIVNSFIQLNQTINYNKIYLKTYYNGSLYDSDEITITTENGYWSSGKGTAADPFIIKTGQDFLNIFKDAGYLNAYYSIANNIDFGGVTYNPSTAAGTFKGQILGNNYVLHNLKLSGSVGSLIENASGANFKNIYLSNITIANSSGSFAGALVANAYATQFNNIIVGPTVSIKGSYEYAGGVVGYADSCIFQKVANMASVENTNSSNKYAGGIVGYSKGTYFQFVYNTANVTGNGSYTGGIAGGLTINDSAAEASILNNVYNTGTIKSSSYHGGLTGFSESSQIIDSYSTAVNSSSSSKFGNIAGYSKNTSYESVYYLTTTTNNVFNAGGSNQLNQTAAKTADEMKKSATFSGFDFTNNWTIGSSYPYFKSFYLNKVTKLSASALSVNKGSSKTLSVTYTPSSPTLKHVTYTSSNTNVATVSASGVVSGIAPGTAIITVKSVDGSNVTATANVTVNAVNVSFGNLTIDEEKNYIKNVSASTKVSAITGQISTSGTVSVVDKNGSSLASSAIIGTGAKVKITVNGTTYNYIVVVKGDVTGDGKVLMGDVMKTANYILDSSVMTNDYERVAGDVTADGKVKMGDVMKIADSVLSGSKL